MKAFSVLLNNNKLRKAQEKITGLTFLPKTQGQEPQNDEEIHKMSFELDIQHS